MPYYIPFLICERPKSGWGRFTLYFRLYLFYILFGLRVIRYQQLVEVEVLHYILYYIFCIIFDVEIYIYVFISHYI